MGNQADIFVANESFVTNLNGEEVIVTKGVTRVRAGHPLLKGRQALFEPLKIHYDVEQATSNPGETRGTRTSAAAAAPAAAKAATPEAAAKS